METLIQFLIITASVYFSLFTLLALFYAKSNSIERRKIGGLTLIPTIYVEDRCVSFIWLNFEIVVG